VLSIQKHSAGVHCALESLDGSRPPSVTRIHGKVFVRWISGLCVYKDSANENCKKKKPKMENTGKEGAKSNEE